DFLRAIPALEKLAKDAPGIAEIHANLGTAYYSVGRYEDAARQDQEALKLKPSLINAHFFLGLSLAEGGRCEEAVPYLEKDYPRAPSPDMKRTLGTDALRCHLSLNQTDRAVDLLRSLNRDFPSDPDLLYLSSHVYSDLATQASERLLATAPGSYQAHQLNAEVLEIQGKPAEAADEYRKVLSLRPGLAGIHYHLGELILAGAPSGNSLDQARQEFEEELKIDPRNSDAEYELGEISRQARQWDGAIEHFKRAASIDPGFAEALIGLGKSLVSAGRPQDAVEPLERAVRLQPENANAHYQLSFAYRRLGREQDAARELAAYKASHDKLQSSRLRIRTGMLGNIAQPQTETPPE
ncbi:MAG TPA: tetratricopeptide repeat protein, partial [Terriglobia bacterium]|nr:tetratricopeptide repeat protein [Terriglobia bacterium]